eukprot:13306092-Heterocapsa_arctica.AAC.1
MALDLAPSTTTWAARAWSHELINANAVSCKPFARNLRTSLSKYTLSKAPDTSEQYIPKLHWASNPSIHVKTR